MQMVSSLTDKQSSKWSQLFTDKVLVKNHPVAAWRPHSYGPVFRHRCATGHFRQIPEAFLG
jgi:hypothetical protein